MKTTLQPGKYNNIFKTFLAQDSEIGNLTEALCKHFSFYRLSKRNRHVNATNFDNDIKI